MKYKKKLLEFLLISFIAFFLHSLNDFKIFSISKWDQDRLVNLTYTWMALVSSYYIYNNCLKLAFNRWKNISTKRLMTILFGISTIIFIWFIIIELLFYGLYYNISIYSLYEETTFYDFDLLAAIFLLAIGSAFFYQKYYVKPLTEENSVNSEEIQKLTTTKGNKQFFIDYRDIGLIYIENEVVMMQTLSGEKYYVPESLSSIINKLSNKDFFRLNRQVIVSRIVVREYEKLEFQKLRVLLIDSINFDNPIIVSKYNAPSFKKWLTNSH